MTLLRYSAKFDPFHYLDCAPTPTTPRRNPSKERHHILPSGNLVPSRHEHLHHPLPGRCPLVVIDRGGDTP